MASVRDAQRGLLSWKAQVAASVCLFAEIPFSPIHSTKESFLIRNKYAMVVRRHQQQQRNNVTSFRFLFLALAVVVFSIANYASEYPICLDGRNDLASALKVKPFEEAVSVKKGLRSADNNVVDSGHSATEREVLSTSIEQTPNQSKLSSEHTPTNLQIETPSVDSMPTTSVTPPAVDSVVESINAPTAVETVDAANAVETVDAANADPPAATSDGRSKLVFHIGPLKTGTTTIQADLTHLGFRRYLKNDGWYYATEGQSVDEVTENIRPMKEVSGADPTFIQDLKAILDKLKGRNVVHSFEGWSVDFANNPDLYRQVHEALSEDWDITIVSGYRPYFDWVVSLWSQTQKRNKFIYGNPDDWPWFEENGKHVKTTRLFPNSYEWWMSKLAWFTDSIVDQASPYFKIMTYNMNDPRDPSVAFVCDCLVGATSSCKRLIERVEENKDKITYENRGSLNPIHYDALGLAAHTKGLIGDQFSRYKIQKAIQEHSEKTVGQTAMKDWPMLCPDQKTFDDLWEKSLRLEKTYMKQLWETNDSREEDLRVSFEKKINDRSFCHVDLDTMLEDSEWLRFFEQFKGETIDGTSPAEPARKI